jgi:UDP-2-acetamido-3-amino-2,3-dideoxy-glucuronate N-acetyltransferase
MPINYFVHETAIVDTGATIGQGTKIWHWVHISAGAKIGERCSLGQNVYVGDKVIIGNNVKIQNNVSIYDNITLGNDVFCGPSMVFTNVYNPRSAISRKEEYRSTFVEDGVTFGANCTIICGVTIGKHAFIGAGTVINTNVKPFALMVGNPGKQIGWMSPYGEQLDLPLQGGSDVICDKTGTKFQLTDGRVIIVK